VHRSHEKKGNRNFTRWCKYHQ